CSVEPLLLVSRKQFSTERLLADRSDHNCMSVLIDENDLPQELTAEQAVEAAYSSELAEVASKAQRGLPALVECDKDLAPFLYMNLRNRLRAVNLRCLYLDGRPRQEEQGQAAMPAGMIGT